MRMFLSEPRQGVDPDDLDFIRSQEIKAKVIDLRGRQLLSIGDDQREGEIVSLSTISVVEPDVHDAEILKLLITPKKQGNMSPEMAKTYRAGFRHAERNLNVFGYVDGLPNRNAITSGVAHRAWVTRMEWADLIAAEAFTHDVTVDFPGAYTYQDRAVCLDHAQSLVRRARTKFRRDFRLALGERTLACVMITKIAPPAKFQDQVAVYRTAILRLLDDRQPHKNTDLQQACGTQTRTERNCAAWAMVHLQKEGLITKVADRTYARAGR